MPRWQQKERGAPFMIRLLLKLAFRFGRRGVRWINYCNVAYFMLTTPRAVRASRHCLGLFLGRPATLMDVARHFFYFSSCTMDRVFLLSNRHQELRIDARWSADIPAVLQRHTGCILIVGHVGSREALRLTPPPPPASADDLQRGFITMEDAGRFAAQAMPVAVLLDRQTGQAMTRIFEELNPQLAANIIDASERGPALVLKLKEALQAGRMVGIGADRANPEERAVTIDFMGGQVRFPEGPWMLAATLRAPVILGFGLYRGGNRYEVHFELFAEQLSLSRAERSAELQAHVQRYAQRLEHYARLAPYNWFNFYDYWLPRATQGDSHKP